MSTASSPNSKKGDKMPEPPAEPNMGKDKAQASPQSITNDDASKVPDTSSPSGEAKSKASVSCADLSPAQLKK